MSLIDADRLIELIDDDIASLDKNMSREGYDVCLCTLKMMKQYIKALPEVEAVPEEQYQRMVYTVASLTEKVGELMDAEPIVRCKDCRWYNEGDLFCRYWARLYEHAETYPHFSPIDSCSRGARKGGGENG